MKNKILYLSDRIADFFAEHYQAVLAILLSLALVFTFFFICYPSLTASAAVSDELEEIEGIPLRTGYMTMPTSAYGFVLSIDSSQSYSDFILDLLDVSTDSSSAFRYRFSGSDPTVYINSFAIENVTVDSFSITASDAFQNDASFASCSIINNTLLSVQFSPVDFVCVTDGMPTTSVLDYYLLAITGFAHPIEMFIDYYSGGGSGTCPTLPEQLASYTGSFDSIVDMLNETNYNEYDSYIDDVRQDARDAGKQEGLEEGFSIGRDAGYMEGDAEGYERGYNKGTSDNLVKGFFANLFGGILEAFDSIEIYNDGTLRISYWSIFCSLALLSLIIIIIKVWRGH